MARRRPPRPQVGRDPTPNKWWPWFLVSLLFLYWVFVTFLERVDLEPLIRPFWETVMPPPVPPFLLFLFEMFHWRVLRHVLPILVGWLLAQRAAVNLMQSLYQISDRSVATDFLRRLQAGGSSGKPIDVKAAMLMEREKFMLLRVGGPGKVKIEATKVAVTEINGRFQRVLGPGKHNLERFEYVHALLDLRPQERVEKDIKLITKDGIELVADMQLSYRIDTGGEPPTPANPYPYSEESVRLATYAQTVLPEGRVSDWARFPQSVARSRLVQIVSRYPLDEILQLNRAVEPYLAIRSELKQQVRTALQAKGLELVEIFVSRLTLPQEVTDQTIQYWQVDWETRRRLNEVDGQAEALEEMEIARAEAEMTMIQAIVEGVQRARREGHPAHMSEIVALRLVDALEQMARQSEKLQPLPGNLLSQLRTMRRELLPDGRETPIDQQPEEFDA